MHVRSIAFFAATLLAPAVAGCGSSDDHPAPLTTGDQCASIQKPMCEKIYGQCGLAGDVTACERPNLCCQSSCSAPATSDQAAVQKCIDDIGAADCGSLVQNGSVALPSSCQGVVKLPAS